MTVSYFSAKLGLYAYQHMNNVEYKNLLQTYTIMEPINTHNYNEFNLYTQRNPKCFGLSSVPSLGMWNTKVINMKRINGIIKVSVPTVTSKFYFILLIYLTFVLYIPEDGHMIRRNMFFVYINSLCAFVSSIIVYMRISHVSYMVTISLPGFHKTTSRQHNITEIKLH
jgi:hypothetical protein